MIPYGSKVQLKMWPYCGVFIGRAFGVPIIQVDSKMIVSEQNIVSYTDEEGKVRKMEEPVT